MRTPGDERANMPRVEWLAAAEQVLREANTPMPYRDITDAIVHRTLVPTQSKTPWITLHASVSLDVRRRQERGLPPRFVIRPGGLVTLAEWEVGPLERVLDEARRSREHASRELLRKLRELDGPDFESFLEVLFTRMGYEVIVTGGAGDDGIDLVAELTGGVAPQRVGIQAKTQGSQRQVGPNVVRLLRDALSSRDCNAGAVVATVSFNDDARRVAAEPGKPPVSLLGPSELTGLALDFKVGVDVEPLELFQENLGGVFEPLSLKQWAATEDNSTRRTVGPT